MAGSREGVARSLACGESCGAEVQDTLGEYQGTLTVVVRVPVVECAGPSPTRLVVY